MNYPETDADGADEYIYDDKSVAKYEAQEGLVTKAWPSKFPVTDPFTDGTVIRYNRIFATNQTKMYNYVAIKCAGWWYLSAQGTYRFSWTTFVTEQLAHEDTFDIEVAVMFENFFTNVQLALEEPPF